MSLTNFHRTLSPGKRQLLLSLCVLGVGVLAMVLLSSLKKPPAVKTPVERLMAVEGLVAGYTNHRVSVTGYGEVRALNTVEIAPEIAGRVIAVHANLEAGGVIPAGEALFELDAREFDAALAEAEADVALRRATLDSLAIQARVDAERLEILKRNRELARAEFERLRQLLENDRVGTRSSVDAAERAYNAAADQAALLARAVALYPVQIREAESAQLAATARLARARLNRERCDVQVDFTARVKSARLEIGQAVAPGQSVATLADDSVLEIHVSLDSRDAQRWLQFADTREGASPWFAALTPSLCDIRWTEENTDARWRGKLNRVVRFEADTRTLVVAIRILEPGATGVQNSRLPLVEGMFCAVSIPGRVLEHVVPLPRSAVSYEETVYRVVDGRLQTVPVVVAHVDTDTAYVSSGVEAGDQIITTRLANPIENTRVAWTAVAMGTP